MRKGVKVALLAAIVLAATFGLACTHTHTPVSAELVEDEQTEDALTDTSTDEEAALGAIREMQVAELKLSAVQNGIRVKWTALELAKVYEIYRKEVGADSYEKIKTTKKLAYTDQTAAYGVSYVYKVRGITAFGEKLYKSKCSKAKKCVTYHIDPEKPMLALTFDDGPSKYTSAILDVLEQYGARATFFEVGNRVASYPETVKRIAASGSEIGNHSYSHPSLANASAKTIKSQIEKTDRAIKKLTGTAPTLLRPPYGAIDTKLEKYAKKPFLLWSVDTEDWKSRDAQKVYKHVMSHATDGEIILMHDLYDSTADAVARMVPKLIKKGYQLVTVSELAQYRGIELKNGAAYRAMKP